MIKIFNRCIKVGILIIVIIVLKSSSSFTENKVENTNINKTVNLSTMAMRIIANEEERLFNAIDSYSGDLTGYVYNCPLCTGRLACMSNLDLTRGRTTYSDEEYGEIKIVASSKNLSCGSIVKFDSKRVSDKPVIAIVLDRGVRGNSLDLLVKDLDYAYDVIGRSFITYEVLRSGF